MRARLEQIRNQSLGVYKEALSKEEPTDPTARSGQPRPRVSKPYSRPSTGKDEIKNLADKLARDKENHLTKLAIFLITKENEIEEKNTLSHIYFFTENDAEACFSDYIRHLGSVPIALLRLPVTVEVLEEVDKATGTPIINLITRNGSRLHRDPSEHRGFRTSDHVAADQLESIVEATRFKEHSYRNNSSNWVKLLSTEVS